LMESDLSNPEAHFGIARILLENNSKLDKALSLTDNALNIYRITRDPNYKDGLLMKGLIFYYLKDNKNAKKYLEEAKIKGVEIPAQLIKELKIK
jgi:tetratricopeptide (TPR) repeat protein